MAARTRGSSYFVVHDDDAGVVLSSEVIDIGDEAGPEVEGRVLRPDLRSFSDNVVSGDRRQVPDLVRVDGRFVRPLRHDRSFHYPDVFEYCTIGCRYDAVDSRA